MKVTFPLVSISNTVSGRSLARSRKRSSLCLRASSAFLRSVMSMRDATLSLVPGIMETLM